MPFKRLSLSCLLLALAAGSAQALGPGRDNGRRNGPLLDLRRSPPENRLETPRPLPQLSDDEVARQAQQRYGGKVLSVRPQNNGGYRVKVLTDGEVRTYSFEPR